jgi:hypothetical protein
MNFHEGEMETASSQTGESGRIGSRRSRGAPVFARNLGGSRADVIIEALDHDIDATPVAISEAGL